MNRTLFAVAGALGASSLLLVDSTVKCSALLVLAACAAMLLRRDSAATRHLVWLLAIVAMLAVPVLSAMLPQWRVLPGWAIIAPPPVAVAKSPPSVGTPAEGAVALPQHPDPAEFERPSEIASPPAARPPETRPALSTPEVLPESAVWSRLHALPLVWALGLSVLMLRLAAARWLLWNSERRGTVLCSSPRRAEAIPDPIAAALDDARLRLGIHRPVTVLMHPDKTIPLVWGLLHCRLLLPEAARQWSAEQLRSVLLHELAHVKRHDMLVQLLAQLACALHWFNPLVWFAAWRLGVERERACDDLVLASGVRPSAYAFHLLDVVTGLAPARWGQSCGLAMARKSSLERRLVAVLSEQLDRRGVSLALAAIALAIAAGIAVPIAMLRAAAEEPAGESQPPAINMKPKHEYAQALFTKWQANARTDGKIPGALIGQVAREIDKFIKQVTQDEEVRKFAALRPRLDASHDWTQADVVALFDDITAISTAPLSWADTPLEFDDMRKLRPGQPLPVELANAAWGAPAANGLRAAWLLEPAAKQYAHGAVLKARVLFHNAGKEPVVFMTETWHQYDSHTARDEKGAGIAISGPRYTGLTPSATYRLAPGEYCEVTGHGVAIGKGKYEEEFSTGSVGAVIEAKEGDEVTLTHGVDASYGGWTRPNEPKDPAELWKKSIADRVEREGPMPQAVADREQLIRRVSLDVFGVAASAEEIAAFTGDNAPDALAKLAARLQAKPRPEPWSGKLPTGETRFRVTAADPSAARAPRTATAPGRYVLADNVHLLVRQVAEGAKRTNTALIAFLSPDPKVASPHEPYEITLPDGIGTYGFVWERGAGVLWVMQKGLVRKHDFTNPAQVKETRFEPGSIADVPEQLRGALQKVFDMPGAPVRKQDAQKPRAGAKLKPGLEEKLKWGEPANGLRAALAIRPASDEPKAGMAPDLYLVMQNVSNAPIRISDANVASDVNLRVLHLKIDGKTKWALGARLPALGDHLLQPREVAFLPMFSPEPNGQDGHTVGSRIADAALKDAHQTLVADLQIGTAPAGAWMGKLVAGETSAAAAAGQPQPRNKEAQALFRLWQRDARENGNIPGGLVGRLGDKVKEFIRNNTGDAAGDPHAKKMAPLVARFDASRDWKPVDVAALMDDVAAVTPIPLETSAQEIIGGTIKLGAPLPRELANAPWGKQLPSGLRVAWLLEPRSAEYRLGTSLKSRILIHNAGKSAIAFRTRTWHQSSAHKAHDATSADIKIDSTEWTTRGTLTTFRLAPGEFIEVAAAGIGVGTRKNDDKDWQAARVGSWIDAKAGDDVTFTPDAVRLGDWNEELQPGGEPRWWLDFIGARLARHLPLPAEKAERQRLLDRVALDLFGTPVSAEIGAAFIADRNPDALEALANRLFHRPGLHAWAGPLTSGPTRFRVLPAAPGAATNPGR
jgi:beta-lactamase regulating signal transducer with metallopeptidase domain